MSNTALRTTQAAKKARPGAARAPTRRAVSAAYGSSRRRSRTVIGGPRGIVEMHAPRVARQSRANAAAAARGAAAAVAPVRVSAHPMQGAELVAGRITQVREVHLAESALADARRVLDAGAAVGDAGLVPRVDARGILHGE